MKALVRGSKGLIEKIVFITTPLFGANTNQEVTVQAIPAKGAGGAQIILAGTKEQMREVANEILRKCGDTKEKRT